MRAMPRSASISGAVTDGLRKAKAGTARAVRAPCGDDTVPAAVTTRLNQAASLADRALTTGAKQAKKLVKRAKKLLRQAKAKAGRASKGRRPKVSSDCAAALKSAADHIVRK